MESESSIPFALGLMLATLRGAIQGLAVLYPSYKTYRALESREIESSQAMLVYWIVAAFINAVKEVVDQLLGKYSSFVVWQATVLLLKLTPLIIGPNRLYASIVRPFFDANKEQIDAVVVEATRIQDIARDAVPAVKQGDTDAAKAAAAEILDVVKSDSSELLQNLQEQASDVTEAIQAKSSRLSYTWDREGVIGVLELIVSEFELLREWLVAFADREWTAHGPFVKKHAGRARQQADKYVPIVFNGVRQRATEVYQKQVAPRVLPLKQKYQESLKPAILAKWDRLSAAWQQYSTPVRNAYFARVHPFMVGTVRPLVFDRLLPFVRDSLLPAVLETILALKDQIYDLRAEPTAEERERRISHKRRRAEIRKEKRAAAAAAKSAARESSDKPLSAPEDMTATAQKGHSATNKSQTDQQHSKRQKTSSTSDSHSSDAGATSTAPSHSPADEDREATPTPPATLYNRKEKNHIDSSLHAVSRADSDDAKFTAGGRSSRKASTDGTNAGEAPSNSKPDSLEKHAGGRSRRASTDKEDAWGSEPRTSERTDATTADLE